MSNPQRLGQHYQRYDKPVVEEFNKFNLDNLNINKNARKTSDKDYKPLSILNENEISYKERTDYIIVTSSDRDISIYPNPSKYVLNLPFELKNISTIEIVNGVIPDKNNVQLEPYLLLNIEELQNVMISNNKPIANAFAILHMAPPIVAGSFINVDKKTFEHVVLNLKTPKASLSKLTLSITDSSGNLFNFGDDSGGPLKALQNMFVLKVVTLEKSRDTLNVRNVF